MLKKSFAFIICITLILINATGLCETIDHTVTSSEYLSALRNAWQKRAQYVINCDTAQREPDYVKLCQIEIDILEPFDNAEFEDIVLQAHAKEYYRGLLIQYTSVDDSEKWNQGAGIREKQMYIIYRDYGLSVEKKYFRAFRDFISEGALIYEKEGDTVSPSTATTDTTQPEQNPGLSLNDINNYLGKSNEEANEIITGKGYTVETPTDISQQFTNESFTVKSVVIWFEPETKQINRISLKYKADAQSFNNLKQSFATLYGEPEHTEFKKEEQSNGSITITPEALIWNAHGIQYRITSGEKSDGTTGTLEEAQKGESAFAVSIVMLDTESAVPPEQPSTQTSAIEPKATPEAASSVPANTTALFTNKYGTPTTKCAHPGCNNYIASSGDTNCCTNHSKRCANCGKYIDEDGLMCLDCIKGGAEQVVQNNGQKCSECSNPATKLLTITDPTGKSETYKVCQKHYDEYKKKFNSMDGWSAW